ncbi:phosphoglucomutase (alpha-D-glucose-1,6-bisphosphate-dependent) [Bdellovibrionota bacterium FG-2]
MPIHPLAGKPAPREILINVPRLISKYYTCKPNPEDPAQRVAFGTSGHRGTSLQSSFNEWHILAITQAVCEYRASHNITGPLFLGMDTHALSEPALYTALAVLAANGVETFIQNKGGYTPTPVISHLILTHNKGKTGALSDGIVITPSHNPPQDGGIKYNPPHGGPADSGVTQAIERRANELLRDDLRGIKRFTVEKALTAPTTHEADFMTPYIADLENVVDLKAISEARIHLGVDPLGGAAVHYWQPIAEKYKLQIEVVNKSIDPTFSFMCVDRDGKIRMDCSSSYAMAGLIQNKDRFDLCFGNDPDTDRHGIVTKSSGLLNPNHYLSVAIWYLFQNRPGWNPSAAIGKTLVSSSMIDRIAKHLNRRLAEVPVGFKWFVEGLIDGSMGFGGEESAGASFLRKDGAVWTTDKDGIILNLLSAEILAKTKRDPGEIYSSLTQDFGSPIYERIDAPATADQKKKLSVLSPEQVKAKDLAGEPIVQKLTRSPHGNSPIGGLKVVTENGWFAARPSGTEDIYKIYAESFKGADHLKQIQEEAKAIVNAAL